MTLVTVDLKDLETLVFATGAIKSIENVLEARQRDPFVKPHLGLTEAHNRLASAMRNATRAQAGTVVNWDEPLDKDEMAFLKEINESLNSKNRMSPFFVIEVSLKPMADRLAAKGCILIGQLARGVVWPGQDRAELLADSSGFAVKVTDRGRSKLSEVTGE